jgi:hypothetical protein
MKTKLASDSLKIDAQGASCMPLSGLVSLILPVNGEYPL